MELTESISVINQFEKAGQDLKERLLALLPNELRNLWKTSSIEELEKVIIEREKGGFKKRTGYHVSKTELPLGASLGSGGGVFYADDLHNLYGRTGGDGYLYIVEGTANDEIVDEQIGWYRSRGAMKVIDRIKLNPEAIEALGVSFARVEYH